MQEFTCSYQVYLQNGSRCLVQFMLVHDRPTEHWADEVTQEFCGLVDSDRTPLDLEAPRAPVCNALPQDQHLPQQVYSWPGCSRTNCCKGSTACSVCAPVSFPARTPANIGLQAAAYHIACASHWST